MWDDGTIVHFLVSPLHAIPPPHFLVCFAEGILERLDLLKSSFSPALMTLLGSLKQSLQYL
jgi:hypothetical protein